MPKGMPNKKYTEFKKIVVETLLEEKMSYSEAERQVGVVRSRMTAWERIYLTECSEGLAACSSQTTSPFIRLNVFILEVLPNFLGLLQHGCVCFCLSLYD